MIKKDFLNLIQPYLNTIGSIKNNFNKNCKCNSLNNNRCTNQKFSNKILNIFLNKEII